MCTKSELQIILNEIADTAKETFGEQLDYTPESDVDIMILVRGIAPEELWKYRSSITSKSSELGLEYNLVIVPLIKDVDTFNKYMGVLPFYQNVDKEGIRIGA